MARHQAWTHSARGLAVEILLTTVRGEHFLNEALDRTLMASDLGERDRALCTQLAYGTMQRHVTLEAFLAHLVPKPNGLKRWHRELLYLSFYQYYYLDHIPDHAIVNEAVKLTKERGHRSQARLTNGVLRRAFREYASASEFVAAIATAPEIQQALTYSLPLAWLKYFKQYWSAKDLEALLASTLTSSVPCIRIPERHKDRLAEIKQEFLDKGWQLEKSDLAERVYRVRGGNPAHTQAFQAGWLTIQDEAAVLPARLLAPQPGSRVLDACAAPGGKTVQLAEKVGPSGEVWANDFYEHKLKLIEENTSRMGVASQVHPQAHDARDLSRVFKPASFQHILVDAPCSGLGLLRRKPDIKFHRSPRDLKEFQEKQLEILRGVLPLLQKGGSFVYSTCTITPEENQNVVEKILTEQPELRLVNAAAALHLPEDLQQAGPYLDIAPQQFQSDGFFMAKFVREK